MSVDNRHYQMAESEEEFVWCSLPGVLVDQHLFSLSQKVLPNRSRHLAYCAIDRGDNS